LPNPERLMPERIGKPAPRATLPRWQGCPAGNTIRIDPVARKRRGRHRWIGEVEHVHDVADRLAGGRHFGTIVLLRIRQPVAATVGSRRQAPVLLDEPSSSQ
jgi:hypothetical protein